MPAVKDSRIAVRLSSEQDALIRRAPRWEGTNITEFTDTATLRHAVDVLADRRMFAIEDAAWSEFLAVLDRPVSDKPRLESSSPSRRSSPRGERVQPARAIAEDDDAQRLRQR